MDSITQLVIGAAIVVALLLVVYLFVDVYIGKKKGTYCRKKVGKKCRAMARRGGHIYMRDLTLPAEPRPARIDHVMIGEFGMVLVNCLDYRGELYGTATDKNWFFYDKENRRKVIANQIARMDQCLSAVRKVLAEQKVYNVNQIDTFVVFGNGVKLGVTRDNRSQHVIVRRKQIGKLLGKEKYLLAGKTDPEKTAAALEHCRVH